MRRHWLVGTVLLLAACTTEPNDPVPSSVTVTTTTNTLTSIGETTQLTVRILDVNGDSLPPTLATWTSSNPNVATVSTTGLVTAVGNGQATITATASSAQGSVNLEVRLEVASVTVAPALDTLESVGDTLALSAVAKDARGNVITGVSFIWASSLPAVATVDQAGRVVSQSDGLATISATNVVSAVGAALAEPVTGHAEVRVRQVVVAVKWEALPANILEDELLAGVRVRLADRRDNPVVNATGTVTFLLSQGSAPGLLSGTSVVPVSGGFAELSSATITRAGVNYRLTADQFSLPTAITPLFTVQHRFASMFVGGAYACGRDFDAATWCWGDNALSQVLFTPFIDHSDLPARAPALDRFSPLLTGGTSACGVDTGELYCWANIDSPVRRQPALIPESTGLTNFASSGTKNYGCGIRSGDVVCFGRFAHPAIPSLAALPKPRPQGVVFIATGIGLSHVCGIDQSRAAWCEGNNPQGQLGNGTISFGNLFSPVAGGRLWAMLDGGIDHTCGLTTTKQLFCWGDNREGQLGDLTLGPRSLSPVAVPTPVPLAFIHVGYAHGCGLGVDQQAYCWGRGGNGEVGSGEANLQNPRVQLVSLPGPVLDVQVGAFFSCALTARGQIHCWGINFQGQRGDGATGHQFLPSPVGVKP